MPWNFIMRCGFGQVIRRLFHTAIVAGACLNGLTYAQNNDHLRTVKVDSYGVEARVPQAWRLIAWGQDDRAFVLSLPQEKPDARGAMSCILGPAPADLLDIQKRYQVTDKLEQAKPEPTRKLIENELAVIDAGKFGELRAKVWGRRLDCVWQLPGPDELRRYELCTHLIVGDTLYTFTLASDEEHFTAYRLDYEEVLQQIKLQTPDTGLERLPDGSWMQRQFRFAIKLPADWRPGFPPHEKALFFARGTSRGEFVESLTVQGSAKQAWDYDEVKQAMTRELARIMPTAKSEFRPVRFGATGAEALEAVIRYREADFDGAIVEWRFSGPSRNYTAKFHCSATDFEQRLPALRESLQSFIEVADEPAGVEQ